MALIARFRVDGAEPISVAGIEGGWVQVLNFSKTFTSGIVGKATTLFTAAGTEEGPGRMSPPNGSRDAPTKASRER
jgi:hypothetical protein